MFAKLLKYEWKASAPLLSTLSLAALGVGLLSGLVLRLSDTSTQSEMTEVLLATATVLTMMFLILALAAYGFSTTLLLLHRFYKNKFTDQGYLTFTLPVSSHQIFLSSLINLLIWQLLTMVVMLLSGLIMAFVGGLLPESQSFIRDMQDVYGSFSNVANGESSLALSMLTGITGWLFGSILTLTCIVLGAAWAKKHKLLLAFALYYGVSFVLQFVTSILSVVTTLTIAESGDFFAVMQITSLFTIALYLLLAVGAYFLSIHMMSKELNLS